MCGLVGYYNYFKRRDREISLSIFERIVETLAHRGPDDKGIYHSQNIGLGHRRLSILDLSALGKQPMASSDETVQVVHNGEIYNFREIRRELEMKGKSFLSESDTEVLLNAYLEWGVESIKKFRGIFAFAIWDQNIQRLWLVRDHIGIKPLYFADYMGTIYFASEIHSLLSFPDIPSDPDPLGIDAYLTFGYVTAPLTGYKHIKQLLPGQYLLFEGTEKQIVQYWDLPMNISKMKASERECIEEFDNLLTRTVQRQMVSDVPVGAFLSSGTDSFAILRAMRRAQKYDPIAFSVGFSDKRYDELDYTELAAKALGVRFISCRLPTDIDNIIGELLPHCQDPFADSSCLPTYYLSEIASKYVKVVLSGDGGDELLGGYSVYKANKYAEVYRRIPGFIRKGVIRPLATSMPDIGGKYSLREKASRFVYGSEQGKWRDHASWRIIVPGSWKKQFYMPEFYKEVRDFDPIDTYVRYMEYAKQHNCSDLDCQLYADLRFYLSNDMLVKVDRMSMAHGLEVRVPFLDVEIVNFCWNLPDDLKIKNGCLKYILRKVISDTYPSQLQKLPKSGFNMNPAILNFKPDSINRFINFNNFNKNHLFGDYHRFQLEYALMVLEYTLKTNRFDSRKCCL
jgi:asparagine synthase (glutamine-hydrolysing)